VLPTVTDDAELYGDWGNSPPAIGADGTVYVGNSDGMRAVTGATGTVNWFYPTPSIVTSAPSVGGDGTIFFGSQDGTFYALKPDGTLRFKLAAGSEIACNPAIAGDGTVYFTANGELYQVK
jgi:outer membrane protein assembly factor BamB